MAGVVEGDAIASTSSSSNQATRLSSSQEQSLDQLKARIQQLEAHSASLEASLRSGRSNHHTPYESALGPILNNPSTGSYGSLSLDPSASPTSPAPALGFHVQPRLPDMQAIRKSFTMNPIFVTWDERSRTMLSAFPDIVERGLIRGPEVNKAFQVFKNQFSQTAPMIPYLLSTTPVPKHPFVVLAAISFVDMLPINAHGMVEESVLFAMTGAADIEVITALYILSFISCTHFTAMHAPLSPLQLISLAYRIGNDLGLEAKSEKALSGDTKGLLEPWAFKRLEELTLWEAVKNRYCILEIECTKCYNLPSLRSEAFPAHPSEHVRHTITYLQKQSRIVQACRGLINDLAQAEADDQWTPMSPINSKWESTLVNLDKARDPDDCQTIAAVAMIKSANALLVEFSAIIPAEPALPESTVTTMVTALACSRRAHEITKHQLEQPLFDESLLETVEAYAEKLPGLLGRILKQSWRDLFHGTPNETPTANGGDGAFNIDFMDFQTFTGL
ncbi:hypothetical protein IAU59_003665 [Kwoniella sp. CBS 9459]